jgi:hypothetical protein
MRTYVRTYVRTGRGTMVCVVSFSSNNTPPNHWVRVCVLMISIRTNRNPRPFLYIIGMVSQIHQHSPTHHITIMIGTVYIYTKRIHRISTFGIQHSSSDTVLWTLTLHHYYRGRCVAREEEALPPPNRWMAPNRSVGLIYGM